MNPTDVLAAASLRSLPAAISRPQVAKPDAAAGHGFQAALEASAKAEVRVPADDFAPPVVQTARHESREIPPLEKFEGFVLRSFVEQMLPAADSSYFGTGTAGGIWRSMLAEQIGDQLAEGGGIGIARLLASRGEGAAVAAASAARTGPELPIGAAFASFAPDQD